MPRQVRYNGTTYTVPDDATDDEIAEIIETMDAGIGGTPPAPASAQPQAEGSGIMSALGAIPDLLPSVGGIIGGMAGKTAGAGIPMAAIGGMAGEGYKQLINNAREIPSAIGDVFTNLTSGDPSVMGATIGGAYQGGREGAQAAANQGATQAVSEATGRGLAAGASALGRGAMSLGMFPSKALRTGFDGIDLPSIAIRERVPVGKIPGTPKQPGSVRMAAKRDAQSGATDILLNQAEQAGITIPPQAMLKGATKTRARVSHEAVPGSAEGVTKLMRDYMMKHSVPAPSGGRVPTPMSPMNVKLLKQSEQAIAGPVRKAQQAGQVVPTGERLRAQFADDVAGDARGALERMPLGFGGKIAKSERRTQELIGAQRGLKEAEARRNYLNPFEGRMITVGGLSTFGGLGGGAAYMSDSENRLQNALTTMIATRMLMDPRFLSRAGLGLTHKGTQTVLQNLPRAATAALETE